MGLLCDCFSEETEFQINEFSKKRKKKVETLMLQFFYSHYFSCNFAIPAHIFLIIRRIIRIYTHRINTANDVNERTRLACARLYIPAFSSIFLVVFDRIYFRCALVPRFQTLIKMETISGEI